MKKKITAIFLCVALLATAIVGASLAYFTDTDNQANTFTVGNVTITLDETDVDKYGVAIPDVPRTDANEYRLIPGHSYTKDPIIHVDSLSEDCYLFVKVVNGIKNYEAATTIADQMTAKDWKVVDADKGIYVYAQGTADKTAVAAGSNVTVFENFTIADNANITASGAALNVDVTAYAVQAEGFAEKTPAQIWTAANFT